MGQFKLNCSIFNITPYSDQSSEQGHNAVAKTWTARQQKFISGVLSAQERVDTRKVRIGKQVPSFTTKAN